MPMAYLQSHQTSNSDNFTSKSNQPTKRKKMPAFKVNHKWAKLTAINDHLYIGGVTALKTISSQPHEVTLIINATCEVPTLPPRGYLGNTTTNKLWLEDTSASDIAIHFDPVADQIAAHAARGGKTLVHCVAGVSRSASLCLAYLMKYQRKSLRESYNQLAGLRPMVRPNLGFWHQLVEYERSIFDGRQSISFVPIYGSDQKLPDVYVIESAIVEEEEEESEVNSAKPEGSTSNGVQTRSSPKTLSPVASLSNMSDNSSERSWSYDDASVSSDDNLSFGVYCSAKNLGESNTPKCKNESTH